MNAFVTNAFVAIAIASATLAGVASPALARAGGGVEAGRDINASAQVKGNIIAVAIGDKVSAHNILGAVGGDVQAGRDIDAAAKIDGNVIAVSIGEDAHSSNVAGSVVSKLPY